MKIITPTVIDESEMTSSIAVDADAPTYGASWQGLWAAGSYDLADVVYKGITLYESLKAANTDDPEVGVVADPVTWLDLGLINQWRMFDTFTNTVSSATTSFEVILTTGDIDHISFFNMVADTLLVEILDRHNLLNVSDWTLSSSGTSEYYYSGTVSEPEYVLADSLNLVVGTIGALSASEWAFGDNDTIGEDRIYVRLVDSTDPDTKTTNYIQYRSIAWSDTTDLLSDTTGYLDWYEYYYLAYPAAKTDATIELGYTINNNLGDIVRITFTGDGTVECGMCVVGIASFIGFTKWQPEMTAIDYSQITTDSFGRTSLTKRTSAKEVSGELIVNPDDTSFIYKILTDLLGVPAVFDFNNAGENTDYEPLIIYGFIRDFREVITFISMTHLNLTIQGMI